MQNRLTNKLLDESENAIHLRKTRINLTDKPTPYRLIISDEDLESTTRHILESFLEGFNILDYQSPNMHCSVYMRTLPELVTALSYITLDERAHFQYRLRKIKS